MFRQVVGNRDLPAKPRQASRSWRSHPGGHDLTQLNRSDMKFYLLSPKTCHCEGAKRLKQSVCLLLKINRLLRRPSDSSQ